MLGDKRSLTVCYQSGYYTCVCFDTEIGQYAGGIDNILIATDKEIIVPKCKLIPHNSSDIDGLFNSNTEFKISESLKWFDTDSKEDIISYLKEHKFALLRELHGFDLRISLVIHISAFNLDNTEYVCMTNEVSNSPIDLIGIVRFILKEDYVYDDRTSWIEGEFLCTRFGFNEMLDEYELTKKYIADTIKDKRVDMRFVDWLIKIDTQVNSTFLSNYINTSLQLTNLSDNKLKEICDKMIERGNFSFFEWVKKPMPIAENKNVVDYFREVRKEIQEKCEKGLDEDCVETSIDNE